MREKSTMVQLTPNDMVEIVLSGMSSTELQEWISACQNQTLTANYRGNGTIVIEMEPITLYGAQMDDFQELKDVPQTYGATERYEVKHQIQYYNATDKVNTLVYGIAYFEDGVNVETRKNYARPLNFICGQTVRKGWNRASLGDSSRKYNNGAPVYSGNTWIYGKIHIYCDSDKSGEIFDTYYYSHVV